VNNNTSTASILGHQRRLHVGSRRPRAPQLIRYSSLGGRGARTSRTQGASRFVRQHDLDPRRGMEQWALAKYPRTASRSATSSVPSSARRTSSRSRTRTAARRTRAGPATPGPPPARGLGGRGAHGEPVEREHTGHGGQHADPVGSDDGHPRPPATGVAKTSSCWPARGRRTRRTAPAATALCLPTACVR
jgi:hypothetical protein